MSVFLEAILLALMVGAGGTAAGALAAIAIRTAGKRISCMLLGLASGLMLATVALDMLPESWEEGGAAPFFIGLILGALVMWFVSGRFHHQDVQEVGEAEAERIAHENLARTGLLLAAGICVHNLPQGVAIGSGVQAGFAATLAVLLLLHNIPEGMAMALPLKIGRVSNGRILYIALVTAIPTVAGAVIGAAVSEISSAFISGALSFAGGSMLYLTIHELIPQASGMGRGGYVVASMVAGFVIGGLVVWALH